MRTYELNRAFRALAVCGMSLACASLSACGGASSEPQRPTSSSSETRQAKPTANDEPAAATVASSTTAQAEEAAVVIPPERRSADVAAPATPIKAPLEVADEERQLNPSHGTTASAQTEPETTKARDAEAPAAGDPNEKRIPVSMRVDSKHWYGDDWQKRATVTMSAAAGAGLSQYPVRVELTYVEGMKPDFSDVRFTAEDGVTEWPYALTDVNPGKSATARVAVPAFGDSGLAVGFLYYGNSAAKPASDARIVDGFSPADAEPVSSVSPGADREIKFLVAPPSPADMAAAVSHQGPVSTDPNVPPKPAGPPAYQPTSTGANDQGNGPESPKS